MFNKVYVIINPASGTIEPVLYFVNKALCDIGCEWEISITKKAGDAEILTRRALRKRYDAVVVYGGDGTVMEAARALFRRKTPLIILPGGTANVLAQELGVPGKTEEALEVLLGKNTRVRKIDVGVMNDVPFLVRVNIGIFAHVVATTSPESKNRIGLFAYGLKALQHVPSSFSSVYTLTLDGKQIQQKGVALFITNSGHLGLPGVEQMGSIVVDDGFLDVIVIRKTDIGALLSLTKSAVTHTKPIELVHYKKAKRITVSVEPQQSILRDDEPIAASELSIRLIPRALSVIVPKG